MGFTEIQDLDCETTFSVGGFNKKTNKPNPTSAVGYYIGSKDVPSTKAKSGFCKLHIFAKQDGTSNFGVWGKTNLDRKMATATVGALTRVAVKPEKLKTKNGDMYQYSVGQDLAQAIEVTVQPSLKADDSDDTDVSGYSESTDGYVEDDSSDAELDADDVQPDEVQAPQPKAPKAPVRTANPTAVQALLNKARAGKSSAA